MSTRRWMTLIGATALGAGLLIAQPPAGRRAWRNADAAQGQRAGRGFQFIARQLNLTEDQTAQAQAIFKDGRTQVAALAPQLKDQREAVQEAVKKNADDNTVQNLAAKEGDLHTRLAAIRIKSMAKFYAMLTPEQREKLAELRGGLQGLFGGGARGWGR